MGWLAGWNYRKTVTITGQAGAGTNYQVKLSIGDASGGDFNLESHCTSFPNDIQVTDNDQTTPLDYWVEDLTVDPIQMWVEVADSLDSNADVCVYYHKGGESSASNGTNTFPELFDHFLGASVDTGKWTGSTGATVANSKLTLANGERIDSISSWGLGYAVHAYGEAVSIPQAGGVVASGFETEFETDSVSINIYSTAYTIYYKSKKDGSLTHYNPGAATGNYQIWKSFRASSSSSKYQVDSGAIYEITTNVPTVDLKATLFTRSGYTETGEFDWVFVRKYNSPEPAYLSASAEESAPAGAIMNQFQRTNLGADLYDGGLIT